MRMRRLLLYVLISVSLIALFLYVQNNSIVLTSIEIENDRLPMQFDGFKILHISDLHGKFFGPNQRGLIKIIGNSKPDLIVFTGDLVDSNHYDEAAGISLLSHAVKIAPVFFVTGNHEWQAGTFDELQRKLVRVGATVLADTNIPINRKDEAIYILGIDDISKNRGRYGFNDILNTSISNAVGDLSRDDFKILLAHRPELISIYSSFDIDVVFSGHAHGGQIRLPFIGGLVAPSQGFFPKYTAGVYKVNNTIMVVNRGLGNSIIPQRVFNRSEVILVTLSR